MCFKFLRLATDYIRRPWKRELRFAAAGGIITADSLLIYPMSYSHVICQYIGTAASKLQR